MRQKFSRSTRVVACETTGANCLAESLAAQKLVTWCGTKKNGRAVEDWGNYHANYLYICMYVYINFKSWKQSSKYWNITKYPLWTFECGMIHVFASTQKLKWPNAAHLAQLAEHKTWTMNVMFQDFRCCRPAWFLTAVSRTYRNTTSTYIFTTISGTCFGLCISARCFCMFLQHWVPNSWHS